MGLSNTVKWSRIYHTLTLQNQVTHRCKFGGFLRFEVMNAVSLAHVYVPISPY